MRKVLAIALNAVRRLLRDRSSIFFVFIFPMLLILVIGATFGGSFEPTLGVVAPDTALASELTEGLRQTEGLAVEVVVDADTLRDDVQRARIVAGAVIPADYDATLTSGGVAEIDYVAGPDQLARQLQAAVAAAVARQSRAILAAGVVAAIGDTPFDQTLQAARAAADSVPGVEVTVETTGESLFENLGRFDLGAAQELALFVFITSLTGAVALIETRNFGVSRRMLSTPTSSGQIIAGELLGRFAVAVTQGLVVIIGALVVFGVDWGDPIGAAALLVAFSLVGAGAAMLLGSMLSNVEQAGAVGVFAALGIAALGGAMVPIEIFPEGMKTVARFTPHAWLLDGFAELVRRGGTILDIGSQLGVLLAMAAGLTALATLAFRRRLTA
ncbi:MAG TPA: ABC transporter permease [Acidimicrobiia bacterium]|jgi:ABC-2 type transport system permease protein